MEMNDAAQETSYYKNAVIEPKRQFAYDALYRLKSGNGRELMGLAKASPEGYLADSASAADKQAVHKYTQEYTYDELGNILQLRHTTPTTGLNWTREYLYDTATNRLLKHDGTQTLDDYSYDSHGNMTQMPHLSGMDWDHGDMLTKTTKGTENTYYRYGAGGERVRKITEKQGGDKVERLYFGGYEVYRELKEVQGVYTTDKERTTVHVSDGQKRIAMVEELTKENGGAIANPTEIVRYQIDDHLGSSSIELNENADIISYEEYHPFGTTSYQKHNTGISQKRYKYVGKERDEETGLYYYGARYYAAHIARFVGVDALQNKYPELTPYQYASNDPIKNIDLDGLEGHDVVEKTAETVTRETFKVSRTLQKKLAEEALENAARKTPVKPTPSYSPLTGLLVTTLAIAAHELFTSKTSSPEQLFNDWFKKDTPLKYKGSEEYQKRFFKELEIRGYYEEIVNDPSVLEDSYLEDVRRKFESGEGLSGNEYRYLPEAYKRLNARSLPEAKLQDHHLFPQSFKPFFESKGIDIDKYTITIDLKTHLRAVHGKGEGWLEGYYNKQWGQWIEQYGKEATKEDIFKFKDELKEKYNLENYKEHQYQK